MKFVKFVFCLISFKIAYLTLKNSLLYLPVTSLFFLPEIAYLTHKKSLISLPATSLFNLPVDS